MPDSVMYYPYLQLERRMPAAAAPEAEINDAGFLWEARQFSHHSIFDSATPDADFVRSSDRVRTRITARDAQLAKPTNRGPKNRRASWLQAEKFKKKCLNELSKNPPARLSRLCHTLSPLARCQNPHSRGPSHSSLVAP